MLRPTAMGGAGTLPGAGSRLKQALHFAHMYAASFGGGVVVRILPLFCSGRRLRPSTRLDNLAGHHR